MLAVVTGASRGLGRLCARQLAAHGANLLLIARDQMALADAAVELKVKYPGREVATLGCGYSGGIWSSDAVAVATPRFRT